MNVKFGAWLLGAVKPESNSNTINKLPPRFRQNYVLMKIQAAYVVILPVSWLM